MTGRKIYQKRSQAYFFLAMYAGLALAGGAMIAKSAMQNQSASNASGFMLVFGLGMFFLTLSKSRRPQLRVFEDYTEVNQSKKKELIRYRNIRGISRPDKNRLLVSLWEDGSKKEITVWLKELAEKDVSELEGFLASKKGKQA